jgi:hypothetical protein
MTISTEPRVLLENPTVAQLFKINTFFTEPKDSLLYSKKLCH